MSEVSCGNPACGAPIPAGLRNDAPPDRDPCPNCGRYARSFSAALQVTATVSVEVSSVQGRPGDKGSTAELDDFGHVRAVLIAPSPKNEEDSIEICERLVRVLNAEGANWSVPQPGTGDTDGFSTDAHDRKKTLDIQVVRASNDQALWRGLNLNGAISLHRDCDALADELLAVIEMKRARYPAQAQRATLTLAIDANRLPGHTFAPVLASFRLRHGATAGSAGFREIWIVGSRDGAVFRLQP